MNYGVPEHLRLKPLADISEFSRDVVEQRHEDGKVGRYTARF